MSASPDPRLRAAGVLARVDAAGAHAARLLGDALPLTRELVLGVLRWRRTLDFLLVPCLRQGLASLDPEVRACLRVGLYEAQRLSTPPPVAVAEAVRVAKVLAPPAAGLVNAVLRRAVSAAWPAVGDETLPLGVRWSHPDWLVERWRGFLGEEPLRVALAADQEAAPLCVLMTPGAEARLHAAGCEMAAHPWSEAVRVITANAAAAVQVVASGGAYAMDPTAALVASLVEAATGPVVDVTAAPGGKLAALALHSAGRLFGADRHFGRVVLLRGNLRRLGVAAGALVTDAGRPGLRPRAFGLVMVDAPCSGSGTLRRHPEIRWRLGPGDLAGLAAVQRRLLLGAAELVAPRGLLLYATCSLEPEENEDVVAGVGLQVVPVVTRLPGRVPALERPSGGVVIPPTPDGDGFSVHLFRRVP